MSDLFDGYDEILRQIPCPEAKYIAGLGHLKAQGLGMLDIYGSQEYKAIKLELIRALGKQAAYVVMNENI